MYEKQLKIAIAAVKASEKTFRKYFGTKTKLQNKSGDFRNLVSLADKTIEKEIRKYILTKFPKHGFVGEENGSVNRKAEFKWVLDPIDGTSNYINGLSSCVISLALLKKEKTVLAVVYVPMLRELYTAILGQGALCNGQPVRVSNKTDLHLGFGALGWSRDIKFAVRLFSKLLPKVLSLRVAGSGTFTLCNVAKGNYDFFVGKGNPAIWDIVAGELIVKEAGGAVVNLKKKPPIQIAANKMLAAKIFKLFK